MCEYSAYCIQLWAPPLSVMCIGRVKVKKKSIKSVARLFYSATLRRTSELWVIRLEERPISEPEPALTKYFLCHVHFYGYYWYLPCYKDPCGVACQNQRLLYAEKKYLFLSVSCRMKITANISFLMIRWATSSVCAPDLFSSRERYWHPTSLKIDAVTHFWPGKWDMSLYGWLQHAQEWTE